MSGLINVAGARSGIVGTTVAAASAGGWTKVDSTASPNANGTFNDIFGSLHSSYTIFLTGYRASSQNSDMKCRFLSSGTTEIGGSDYRCLIQGGEMSSGAANAVEYRSTWNGDTMMISAPGGGQSDHTTVGGVFGQITIHNPYDNTRSTMISGNLGHVRYQESKLHTGTIHGGLMLNTRVQGIRLWFSSGNVAAGKVHIYGHTD
jgi:hypothetical protein